MEILQTSLKDCFLIQPSIHRDSRGLFLESFQLERYRSLIGLNDLLVQDNFSRSSFGTLRGLHFQKENPQGKLAMVSMGAVLDVVVDLRPESETFSKWESFELNDQNLNQLWIPPGFAHGFLVLSKYAHFHYKCTAYYNPEDEGIIRWDDPTLNIAWPDDIKLNISEKDKNALFFKQFISAK